MTWVTIAMTTEDRIAIKIEALGSKSVSVKKNAANEYKPLTIPR